MKQLRSGDFDKAAQYVYEELARRKDNTRRLSLEKTWKDIDRQIALNPKLALPRDVSSGQGRGADRRAWMSSIELPLQANALEVLVADAKRLIFPRDLDWYQANAVYNDREAQQISEALSPSGVTDETVKQVIQKMQASNQEGLDLICHSVIDYSHVQYDYFGSWDAMIGEAYKYGTFSGRMVKAKREVKSQEWRGANRAGEWAFLIPVSIKNLYLDDTMSASLNEGLEIMPATIQTKWQGLDDLKRAAKAGGSDKGWILSALDDLEPEGNDDQRKRKQVEIAVYEGDLLIPRSRDNIFVPNVVLTVAIGSKPKLVRYQENPYPFRSFITGVYQKDDIDSPYGTSPLVKGRPVQEAACEAMNRLIDVACLQAEPPQLWNENENALIATGGLIVAPGSSGSVQRPETAVKLLDVGDIAGLASVVLQFLKLYEDMTGVTDPRRGGDLKSHTTALAADLQSSRSVLRTEDFVNGVEQGPLTTALYMEYYMVRDLIGNKPIDVLLDARGVKGHIEISKKALPARCDFLVQGSRGALSRRERQQNFLQWAAMVAQTYPLLQQEGTAPEASAMLIQAGAELGVLDAGKFLRPASATTGPEVPGGPGLSGTAPAALTRLVQGAGL